VTSTNFIKSFLQPKNLFFASSIFFLIIFPLLLIAFNDVNKLSGEQSFCPFKLLSGFPCPGCGITKSLVFLYLGEWRQSIRFHFFGPLLVFGILFMSLIKIIEHRGIRMIPIKFLNEKKIALLMAVGLGVYHFYRLIIFVHRNNFDSILRESIWK
jgi:hypothetical protein